MKTHTAAIIASFLMVVATPAQEYRMVKVNRIPEQSPSYSDVITLAPGDLFEVLHLHPEGVTMGMGVTVAGEEEFWVNPATPVKYTGPMSIRFMGSGIRLNFATVSIKRTGTSTNTVPIPTEAGTTWQVLLEASSDLVNWTAIQPGDYPSSTPQRYFRTRLVRK